MANYFTYCEGCKQRKWRVAKRKFKLPNKTSEVITSQSELCRTCYTNIKRMLSST